MRKLLLVAVAALAAFSASAAVTGAVVARNGGAVANATVTLYALETPTAQFDRLRY